MIKTIDAGKCTGCEICVNSCGMDVIRMDAEKGISIIKYQEDCMTCFNCERDCPARAIYVAPERAKWVVLPW